MFHPDKHNRNVFLVEDNPDICNVFSLILQLKGYRVANFLNGRSAVTAIAGFQPDIAIIDIGLPDINGFEIADQIRSLETKPTVLVALTGFDSNEMKMASMSVGFDMYFVKPVDIGVVCDRAEKLIQARRALEFDDSPSIEREPQIA